MAEYSYSELRAAPVRVTMAHLARRIDERFPGSGLSDVAVELLRLTDETASGVENLRRPIWWLRVLTALAISGVVALAGWVAAQVFEASSAGAGSISDLLQGIEAGINELIFLSLAIYFLASLEIRLKRRIALRMLHRVRSVAHVVDMHQLTKDPEPLIRAVQPTASSPDRSLSPDQLARYLDYCSELLALTSKLAALHAEGLQDAVVLSAVNDVETLCSDLSRKIWQKITILDLAVPAAARSGLS